MIDARAIDLSLIFRVKAVTLGQEEFERSKAQGGYENDPSNKDPAIHQYFVVRGKTKYLVRDSFQLSGSIAVEVRCQRPLLATTPAAWNAEFDKACGAVVASLKH